MGKIPDLKALGKATHGHEISMMFPAFEAEMGPLSEEEAKYSKKFIKFCVEFMKRGHPKQDEKYEFKDWLPVANGQLTICHWQPVFEFIFLILFRMSPFHELNTKFDEFLGIFCFFLRQRSHFSFKGWKHHRYLMAMCPC